MSDVPSYQIFARFDASPALVPAAYPKASTAVAVDPPSIVIPLLPLVVPTTRLSALEKKLAGLVVPTPKLPLASRVIAWVKVIALPAVPDAVLIFHE